MPNILATFKAKREQDEKNKAKLAQLKLNGLAFYRELFQILRRERIDAHRGICNVIDIANSNVFGGIPTDTYTDPKTSNPLLNCLCANEAEHEAVRLIKTGRGLNPNLVDSSKKTGLIAAAKFGQSKVALLLLENFDNLEVNAQDDYGCTAMHYAYFYGDSRLIAELRKRGVSDAQEDNEGQTPIVYLHSSKEMTCEILVENEINPKRDSAATINLIRFRLKDVLLFEKLLSHFSPDQIFGKFSERFSFHLWHILIFYMPGGEGADLTKKNVADCLNHLLILFREEGGFYPEDGPVPEDDVRILLMKMKNELVYIQNTLTGIDFIDVLMERKKLLIDMENEQELTQEQNMIAVPQAISQGAGSVSMTTQFDLACSQQAAKEREKVSVVQQATASAASSASAAGYGM